MAQSDKAKVELGFESAAGGEWKVVSAAMSEQLNAPYRLAIELHTDDMDAESVQMLGKSATLTLTRADATRQIHGVVAEVEEGARPNDEVVVARIVIRPALEALRHRVDTRIFQDKTVPEILDEVLSGALGGHQREAEQRLSRTYPTCEYRVQYDESDFAFCQRLMEEEGIAYWFEHDGDVEKMVLADAAVEHATIESAHGATLDVTLREAADDGKESILVLDPRSRIRPTKLATRHFDWTHPSTPIEGASSDSAPGDEPNGAYLDPEREIYQHDHLPLTLHEYDGSAYGANDVEDQARIRRESHAFGARIVHGESNVIAMRTGGRFDAVGHAAPELDRGYVVLSASHRFSTTGASGHVGYRNYFRAIPDDVAYRPPRLTPRPRIPSTQSARVVGPAGEEIHTDNHGRIRVQFHWDRVGANDEHSTRWVRVMQPWAGASWGHVFIPRIGMEVMVQFVGGDPDHPLVIGSVYDGERPVPYPLPDEKTKSTIKTESSLGGGGNNELRFEDKAGSEEVYIHAQKDFNEVVENDHTTTVHHDQSIRVDNNQVQEIGVDQTEHVFANQDLTVDANRTIAVHGNFEETIDGSETKTVSSGATETITAGETRTVTGGMTETISGGRTQTITGASTETINGSLTQTINGAVSITTPATYEITAAAGFSITTPAAVTIIAPGGYTLLAPGGQTSIDESWFNMGNKWFDSYGIKCSTVATKFSCCYLMNIALQGCAIDIYGAKLTSGGAFEEFKGAKLKTTGAKIRGFMLGMAFCGLANKT